MKRWMTLTLFCAGIAGVMAGDLNYDGARDIAIQTGGRKKPLDTFAAESLQTITGRRTFRDPAGGKKMEAMEVLFSMWLGHRDWESVPMILVSDSELHHALGLSEEQRLVTAHSLLRHGTMSKLRNAIALKRQRNEELTPLENAAEQVFGRIFTLQGIRSGRSLTIVPNPEASTGKWVTVEEASRVYGSDKARSLLTARHEVARAVQAGDAEAFETAVVGFKQNLSQLAPEFYPSNAVLSREIHYNQLHPFRLAWIMYLAAFFALFFSKNRWFGQGLFGAGVLIHAYGFGLRCWVAGYVPVSNMYESVVWVSFGIAALALIFAAKYKAKIYLLSAAPLAVLGLIVADMLPTVLSPKIGPLPPVLRDNFWLVTHVVTITLGYAAFALALGLGHVILGRYLVKPAALGDKSSLYEFLYRALQIGVLLLAAGTILGGVWAYYAWGRFWGWDPKETWALIALLLYIFVLHGRVARWWGNFGLAVGGILCFNGVLMAWYGVNYVLGTGLHSYGFGGGGLEWVAGLVGLDVLFVAVCVGIRVQRLRRAGKLRLKPMGEKRVATGETVAGSL